MTTIDECLAWVDQLTDHMDCGCYDTHKALAAEVRRLRKDYDTALEDCDAMARQRDAARAEAARLRKAMHAADKRMNDALRADLARAESERQEATAKYVERGREIDDLKADLARARAVLESIETPDMAPWLSGRDLVNVSIDRAAWQAWRERQEKKP